MRKNEVRYIVTDVVSIPVVRIASKKFAYEQATKPGYGVVEWYGAVNDYKAPVTRDRSDKAQVMYCGDDDSAVLYPASGAEFVISSCEAIDLRNAPTQSAVLVITQSDSCGFSFWAKESSDVKIFVTYNEDGLVETFRFDNWVGKPYDGEVEISFDDLQSQSDYDNIARADIVGTLEYARKQAIEHEKEESVSEKHIAAAVRDYMEFEAAAIAAEVTREATQKAINTLLRASVVTMQSGAYAAIQLNICAEKAYALRDLIISALRKKVDCCGDAEVKFMGMMYLFEETVVVPVSALASEFRFRISKDRALCAQSGAIAALYDSLASLAAGNCAHA